MTGRRLRGGRCGADERVRCHVAIGGGAERGEGAGSDGPGEEAVAELHDAFGAGAVFHTGSGGWRSVAA